MAERDEKAAKTDDLTDPPSSPAGDEADDYGEPGFDPEQRRFLWTITAVLVLAMFASTGLNVYYQERQHSRQVAINRANDAVRAADSAFSQAQQFVIPRMAAAQVEQNKAAYDAGLNEIMGRFQTHKRALEDLRRAEELDESTAEPSDEDFANAVKAAVESRAAQMRAQRAATSRPATQSGAPAATGPAGPAAPTTPAP